MKSHILKAEVSPKTKFLLSEIAKTNKRSLKKQVEYIIEEYVTREQQNSEIVRALQPQHILYKGVPDEETHD